MRALLVAGVNLRATEFYPQCRNAPQGGEWVTPPSATAGKRRGQFPALVPPDWSTAQRQRDARVHTTAGRARIAFEGGRQGPAPPSILTDGNRNGSDLGNGPRAHILTALLRHSGDVIPPKKT